MKKRLLLIVVILTGLLMSCEKETTIEIKLNAGQDTVELNFDWVDKGAVLKVGSKEYQAVTDDQVDTTTLGLYKVEYYYEYDGKEYKIIRYVNVVDQLKPIIELNPGIDTIKVGEEWLDAGAEAFDNSQEDIEIIVSGEVDTTKVGTYQIIYKASDASGNTTEIIRYVNVVE